MLMNRVMPRREVRSIDCAYGLVSLLIDVRGAGAAVVVVVVLVGSMMAWLGNSAKRSMTNWRCLVIGIHGGLKETGCYDDPMNADVATQAHRETGLQGLV